MAIHWRKFMASRSGILQLVLLGNSTGLAGLHYAAINLSLYLDHFGAVAAIWLGQPAFILAIMVAWLIPVHRAHSVSVFFVPPASM
ncbi:MAG: hypothetical protein DRR06_14055 [Gammaproteobacteria bacterium]|nr:MAG: hypothetical protein DRR06_14055 [Gammaproteobacteria bacterium]